MKLSFVLVGLVSVASLGFAAGCASGDAPAGTPGAGAGAGAPTTCGATPYAAGCDQATTPGASNSEKAPSSTPPGVTADICHPKTCEDFKGACGSHDDGCGKSFSCGECKSPQAASCTPKSCKDLGQTCGNHDDGCGGTTSCGACETGCAMDAKEPNDSNERATDLGALKDSDDKTITTPDLDSSDGDTDWFKIAVTDGLDFTNPQIIVSSTDTKLEVSAFHVCNSMPNYSYCYGASDNPGTQDNELGNGCTGMGTVTLKTDCSGIDESGTAYIRVRKTVSDGTCHSYDLSVEVY